MGNINLAVVLLVGSLLTFTDAPEQIRKIIDDSIHAGQQIATAGDLRTISTMLDIHYFKHGRYPTADRFGAWMTANFKENNLKELTDDHWGHPYRYTDNRGKGYILRSLGEDGLEGTTDDMTVTGP